MTLSHRPAIFVTVAAALVVVACSGKPAAGVYDNADKRAVVVGDGKGGAGFVLPEGSGCLDVAAIQVDGGECVRPQDKCGANGRADVVVDSSGNVIDILCYPLTNDINVVPAGNVESLDFGNKTGVILDGANDGVDVTGDVTIDGNNSYIFGQGPDVSVLGGNVDVVKNNAGVRGVRVQGNFTIHGNDASLVLAVIEGDLVIEGNNAIVAEVTVLGNIIVKGNNTQLVGNHVKGEIQIEGQNTACDGNTKFADANGDKTFQVSEKGEPLTCSKK